MEGNLKLELNLGSCVIALSGELDVRHTQGAGGVHEGAKRHDADGVPPRCELEYRQGDVNVLDDFLHKLRMWYLYGAPAPEMTGHVDAGKGRGGKAGPVLCTENIPPKEVYDRAQSVTERVYGRVRDFHKWVLESRMRPAGNANCERFMYDVCTTAEGSVLTKAWDFGHDDTPYYRNEHFVGTFDDADRSAGLIFGPFRDAVCAHCGLDTREHVLHEIEGHEGDVWTGAKLTVLRGLIEDEVFSFNGWLSESCTGLRRIELRFTCRPHLAVILLRREGGAIVCLNVSDTCDGLTAEEAAGRITSKFELDVCAELGLHYDEYVGKSGGHEVQGDDEAR